jgi:hypothetical protein
MLLSAANNFQNQIQIYYQRFIFKKSHLNYRVANIFFIDITRN